jgi:iron complex transport system substrate-binding protein
MGETCVPEHPERVIVLDTGHLDGALSLGVKPIGSVEAFAGAGFPSYLDGMTEGIEVVGTIAEPNLEAILALDPDLILSATIRHEAIYPQLAAIAPTVFTESVGVVWKENLDLFAEALNRHDLLAIRWAEYEARIAAIRRAVPVEEIEVSIIRFVSGENRLMQRGSFIGTVIDDVGFARPESQQSEEFMLTISQEQIDLIDGDVVFVSYYGDPAQTEMSAFLGSPLWQTLSAAQNGNVYEVDDDHWFLGIGFLGANRVFDDLLTLLADYGAGAA